MGRVPGYHFSVLQRLKVFPIQIEGDRRLELWGLRYSHHSLRAQSM